MLIFFSFFFYLFGINPFGEFDFLSLACLVLCIYVFSIHSYYRSMSPLFVFHNSLSRILFLCLSLFNTLPYFSRYCHIPMLLSSQSPCYIFLLNIIILCPLFYFSLIMIIFPCSCHYHLPIIFSYVHLIIIIFLCPSSHNPLPIFFL